MVLDYVTTVQLQFEAGARTILDAVLLTIADISLDAKENFPVSIFPEMRIASGDGVLVRNTANQFEVWLTGNIDYGVLAYKLARGTTCLINFLLNITTILSQITFSKHRWMIF